MTKGFYPKFCIQEEANQEALHGQVNFVVYIYLVGGQLF
jgi:hypothetical protein